MGGKQRSKGPFIGAIDQGTTSSRFLIFNSLGQIVAQHQLDLPQYYPRPGWHEQDPREIVDSVLACIDEAVGKFKNYGHEVSDIRAVGIANQRETTVVWDWITGEPLYKAIAWPDTRTQAVARQLKKTKAADDLRERSGLPISTYPSAVKLLWLLQNVESVKKAYENGSLAFGTVDTWLIYKLNGGKNENVYVTDVTNASRTMFMNLSDLKYDEKSLSFFGIDSAKIKLPTLSPSADAEAFGCIRMGALQGHRITGCLGDQSAALVGQKAFGPGSAKNTYGTGCFLLYNTGERPVPSQHNLITTVGYWLGRSEKPVYALEGSVAAAGSAVKFLVHNLGLAETSQGVSELAGSVKDSGGCVFVTAFSGLFAPYWIDDAKGSVFGITHHTKKSHIARAALEATCLQTRAIIQAMQKDSGKELESLVVDGGMTSSDVCMQIQADVIGIPVDRPAMMETTALGAAIAAGLVVGVWKDVDDLHEINTEGHTIFKPQISHEEREALFCRWNKAVDACRGWTHSDDADDA